ncbi:hypothetical protein FA10DRAFT_300921 [Acaromyces ingoldii]|uniref:Stress-associated endoplasmic reticulum protein n=1 Tax=Acaromyces ingoldii TaxID=215250 RepID=A0A316YUT6_9BASI|nr:hypothetical protein FA10DRAFT_300921 [Acaromyces ingoldii]PWN92438.1 hypothetical protein FA10DRAFT_300921 [Acaromyces ingoldii]
MGRVDRRISEELVNIMPTGKDIRAKNERNAKAAREGKTKPRKPYQERVLAKRSPVGTIALSLICFVVIGGVVFELARLFL